MHTRREHQLTGQIENGGIGHDIPLHKEKSISISFGGLVVFDKKKHFQVLLLLNAMAGWRCPQQQEMAVGRISSKEGIAANPKEQQKQLFTPKVFGGSIYKIIVQYTEANMQGAAEGKSFPAEKLKVFSVRHKLIC